MGANSFAKVARIQGELIVRFGLGRQWCRYAYKLRSERTAEIRDGTLVKHLGNQKIS
jgi:hypothetical protein